MSDLDKIKKVEIVRPKIKRYLEDVNFDFESEDGLGPHVAMTSGLGAASLMNDSYMFKSINKTDKEQVVTYTEEEVDILKAIGEWNEADISIDKTITTTVKEIKSMEGEDKAVVGVDKRYEALEKQMADLTKTNNVLISKDLIKDFGFSVEVEKGVAEILADIEAEPRELLVKAFEAIKKDATDKVVAKAVEDKADENPLKKALDIEAGFEDETSKNELEKDNTEIVEKSMVDKLKEHFENRNKETK